MITIALTGSIGMGKSTVAAMFARLGIPVFDADATVRRLQGPGGSLVGRIEQRFPGTTADGQVDREALAGRVLGQPDELAISEDGSGLSAIAVIAGSLLIVGLGIFLLRWSARRFGD